MQCKICGRERPVRKCFKTAYDRRICDECLEDMGYGHQIAGNVYSNIEDELIKKLNTKVVNAVNQELPKLLEKLMVESDLTFELKVI